MKSTPVLTAAALLALSTAATADAPSNEEMWAVIRQQQEQIETLRRELQYTQEQLARTSHAAEAAQASASETEQNLNDALDTVDEVIRTASAPQKRVTFGGYGELHINGGDKDEIDFHRFVMFTNFNYSDRLRFNSELEVEHALAGDGAPGEVEVEQAFIEYDLTDTLRARGGLFLVPVGILNETHEPDTFYGVERNAVESNIIPTTWWEGGAGLNWRPAPDWSVDLAAHSGLNTNAGASYRVRSGRQKVAEATFEDAAFTGRVKYTGIPGLELAASLNYQSDITQGLDPLAGDATLFTTHAVYRSGAFGLRALLARWDLDGAGPESIGADEQEGWFLEPSWQVTDKLGVFARYARWDNAAGDDLDSEFSQAHFGINYWLHPNVVVKADYQIDDAPTASSEDDRVNVGIGYQF